MRIRNIDRKALITRHNPVFRQAEAASLSVGNGRFCFTADWTGVQTFDDGRFPLLTMAEWFWHSYAGAPSDDKALRLTPYDTYGRDVGYATDDAGQEALFKGLRQNAHKGNLARLSLETGVKDACSDIFQELNLWEGVIYSSYKLNGAPVDVQTLVHPENDVLYVRFASPLLAEKKLRLRLDFPYPAHKKNAGSFSVPEKHSTRVENSGGTLKIFRDADGAVYTVEVQANPALQQQFDGVHTVTIEGTSESLELSLCFLPENTQNVEPCSSFACAKSAAAAFWADYWQDGGAMEFFSASDKRAFELERRVVLSAYLCAIQSRGMYPPAETGLACNSWYGKFHLEMHFWHQAHFALWNRAAELEKSLGFYLEILPEAQKIAAAQGYAGARWPKMCGPAGYNSPSSIAVLLLWQQPHPVMLAELCYRAENDGVRRKMLLEKYREVVFESAEFMASFVHYCADGSACLGPPAIPVQERFDPHTVCNPPFEAEYFRWGLRRANIWLERLGEPANSRWEKAAAAIRPPAEKDGVFLAHENCPETWTTKPFYSDHPSMLMMKGVLDGDAIDSRTMSRTLDRVLSDWEMDSLWGWDFPMMAMTAARLGRADDAVNILLMDNPRNVYLANGHNMQGDKEDLPLYLPGNGALLLAVAAMKNKFPAAWQVSCENIGDYWQGDGT